MLSFMLMLVLAHIWYVISYNAIFSAATVSVAYNFMFYVTDGRHFLVTYIAFPKKDNL